ncbi:hypothetical protein BDV98DRAFT_573592 [Pterulicium gracile]|uniref:Beta-lactamase-like protein n=1 Tax=Pterulicium gracile TaxID=1884261 RepID=A0A5C3Q708_9AGAR|nr:hypothetical protein BDV98DRAFT_573592 [Pterula gracilis]
MSELVIREVAKDLWTFSVPFTVFGLIAAGGRSIAIRHSSGGVWVLASTPLCEDQKAKIAEIGEVRWIVAGGELHHLYLKEWKAAYPSATLVGLKELVEKKGQEGVKFDAVFESEEYPKLGYEDEILACYFSGAEKKEIVWCHTPTKTAIVADMLFNLPANEQYSKSKQSAKLFLLGALNPTTMMHRLYVGKNTPNPEVMKKHVKIVDSWDFTRVIPLHGDVFEGNGKEMWRLAFQKLLQ